MPAATSTSDSATCADDERAPQPVALDTDDAASGGPQREHRAPARGAKRGREPEQDTRQEPQRAREGEDPPVGLHLQHDGGSLRAEERDQALAHDRCQQHATCGADRGDERAFRQQLPDDARARGPEAEADRDLAVPRAGPCQQQVREVRARDQQHDACRREQHPERMLVRLAQHRVAGAARRRCERERLVARRAGGRIRRRNRGLEDAWGDGLQLRGGALERPPGLEAADRHEPPVGRRREPIATVHRRLRTERHGDVEAAAHFEAAEPRRRDADHLSLVRVQREGSPDRVRVAAHLARPERVAEHDPRRAARLVVGGRDEPPGRRRDAEHVKERARDEEATRGTHLAAVREVERGAAPGGDVREALLLAADLLEDRVVERIVGGSAVAAGAVHVDDADAGELPRPRDRQRSQPHRVDDLEDRGGGADAEREREDGNHGETGAPAQQACGVAEILSEAGEPDASVHVPGDLLHDHDLAELAANRGFGLGA